MRVAKTAYQLRESQVSTPPEVVSLFWKLVRKLRPVPGRVLDLGAGDGRFAVGGHYTRYDGIEIDPKASAEATLPKNAKIKTACAFKVPQAGYDICIGNPPYVRHHDIEPRWRRRVAKSIEQELGITLSGIGNLYLYFLCLGLLRTHDSGLVAFVVPFEWVSRPSAKPVREYLQENEWNVSIYRFKESIFDDVLTTASIAIIDKNNRSGKWTYHDIFSNLKIKPRRGISGSRNSLLPYSRRGRIWARRGISPGGQKIFTLTEAERLRAGLHKTDVLPCVTTLKHLPTSIKELNWQAFESHFVKAGRRCWLIKTGGAKISPRVRKYLDKVPKVDRQTYACQNQKPWFRYESPPVPTLLFHSGFMKHGPKIAINAIGAHAIGSVYGVHGKSSKIPARKLREHLAKYHFERRIVAHAHTLRKVEVAQLNSVLSNWLKRAHVYG